MRMAVLQHVECEGPAAVTDWAAARGFLSVNSTCTAIPRCRRLPISTC